MGNDDRALKVLLVEDDEHDRLVFERTLKKSVQPFEVSFCARAEEAIEAVDDNPYVCDLMVVDHGLPGLSGLELCRQLTAEGKLFPLVILTGSGSEEIAIEAIKLGVDDYIVKDPNQHYLALLPVVLPRVIKKHNSYVAARHSELALKESERLRRHAFDAIPDRISVHDKNLRVIMSNWKDCGHVGADVRESRPLCHKVFFGNPDVCHLCPAAKVFSDGEPRMVEWNDEAEGRTYELSIYPVFDDNGGIPMITEHLRDITERKKAEEERRELETRMLAAQKLESMGVLAGGIAHDFKNLLAGIIGNAELALSTLGQDLPQRDNLKEIIQVAENAADLSRQMLAYSGKGRFVLEPLKLSELVEAMGHLLDASISKKAFISYNLAHEMPRIKADPAQVRQTLMNLVSNASEALDSASGLITVSTGKMFCDNEYIAKSALQAGQPEGLYAYLEVSDTGCGIDPEHIGKIFDPFFSTKFTGRGLGLAAVLGIVRGHEGLIRVTSRPGKGSTVRVLFPVLAERETAEAVREEAPDMHIEGTATVLLVDDEEFLLSIVKRMLESLGFQVLTATDGIDAVELYSEHGKDIALVLLDLTMPRMNGEEAFIEIRKMDPDARIVLSSGYNEQDVAHRFEGMELDGFLGKPYQIQELKKVIGRVLGRAGRA